MQDHQQPHRAVFKLNQPDDNDTYLPLPASSGRYPFRLKFTPRNPDQMTFHMVGDTGGIRDSDYRHRVAAAMTDQLYAAGDANKPEFLYHLGDVVYNFGEASEYAKQFFIPYKDYKAPIFAIAGNHDGGVNPAVKPYQTLDAFKAVFCDSESRSIDFDGGTGRKSNTQPNVYWTLETPLAILIGLNSNLPKFGIVTNKQREWLIDELKWADTQRLGKVLLLAIHHAPYSADTNHGSSLPMIELLEGVFRETGIRPDVVMSGHVHNYQRFKRTYPQGRPVTYLVAGAGGYDELHPLAEEIDPRYSGDSPLFDNIELQAYQDDRHGFLKISIEKVNDALSVAGKYYHMTGRAETLPVLSDEFVLKIDQ